ncbi:MAG: hypothetical protein BroJett018_26220 [Chloroflexota bacterium]|nr:MAG: hypothetical protein BroJett018_26220 [Chloroflexota bacterium]
MPRLLRATVLLVGLSLVIQTFSLIMLRRDDASERVPVVMETRRTDYQGRLLQIWPGVERPYTITPDFLTGVRWLGVDTNRTTAYFSAYATDPSRMNVYHVSPTLTDVQTVIENAVAGWVVVPYSAYNMPADLEWLIYAKSDPNGAWIFWMMHLPTQREYNLTEWIDPYYFLSGSNHFITNDGRFLLATVVDEYNLYESILRIDLSNGSWINITEGSDLTEKLYLWGQVGDWVLFKHVDDNYRVALDGYGFGLLVNDTVEAYTGSEFVSILHESSGLAVVERNHQSLGVEVGSRKIIWRHEGVQVGFSSYSDQDWVLAQQGDQWFRLYLPTGELQFFPAELNDWHGYPVVESSNRRLLVFGMYDYQTQVTRLGSLDWETLKFRRFAQTLSAYYIAGISPDDQWLWLYGSDGESRLRLSDGHLEHLITGDPYGTIYDWMRPLIRTWQPIPLMLIAIALFVIGLLPRRLFGFLRRPVLMSRTLIL